MSAAPLLANLLRFTRLLRRLGFEIGPDRLALWVEALACVEISHRRRVKDVARAVLVSRREELALFDRAFDEFFALAARGPKSVFPFGETVARGKHSQPRLLAATAVADAGSPNLQSEEVMLEARRAASDVELLRRKDFAQLTSEERASVRRALRLLAFPFAKRRSRRFRTAPRGERSDLRASLKASQATGGEVIHLLTRRRKVKPRSLVVLADISGSMEPYARMFLELLYALKRGGPERREIFVFATRLTHLTRSLAAGPADQALALAAAEIRDWGGGTRIGEVLARFHRDWARRVLGRGAVVLLITDGWDCGEPETLRREVERLKRSSHRLVWLNPLLGIRGYEPLTRGAQTLLAVADEHLPVFDLASVEDLAARLARVAVGAW